MVWLVCNTGWFIYDVVNEIYSRAFLDAVQSAFCIYGYINWGRNNDDCERETGLGDSET